MLMKELSPAQIHFVCFDIRRRNLLDGALLVFREHEPQSADDTCCNLVLNRKDIFELAIVPLGPELRVVCRVHELRGQTQSLSGFADASLEDSSDLKLSTDLSNILCLVFERKRRCARRNLQRLDLRQRIDDLLGHSISK